MRKRQRRLSEVDQIVLSLTARELTTGEVAAHFAEVCGARVSRYTISRITDKVVAEMTEWGRDAKTQYDLAGTSEDAWAGLPPGAFPRASD